MRVRRLRWLVAALGALSTAAIAAACGLDEGETATVLDGGPGADVSVTDGGTTPDVAIDVADVFVPPTCATIDASCLGTPVPSGWALLGVASGTQACPSPDFDPVALVENPRLTASSCTCGACVPAGTFACTGFSMKTGGGCGGATFTRTLANPCVADSQSGGGARVSAIATNPPVANGVGCTIPATGTGQAATDPLSGCRPNTCEADFCGLGGKGFKTCIVHDDALACPSGFTLRGYAGGAGAANCAGCACAVSDGRCTGSVRVFAGNNGGTCDGDGGTNGLDYKITVGADGGCMNPGVNYDGLYFAADPPPAVVCAPAAPTAAAGDAGLLALKTICCSP